MVRKTFLFAVCWNLQNGSSFFVILSQNLRALSAFSGHFPPSSPTLAPQPPLVPLLLFYEICSSICTYLPSFTHNCALKAHLFPSTLCPSNPLIFHLFIFILSNLRRCRYPFLCHSYLLFASPSSPSSFFVLVCNSAPLNAAHVYFSSWSIPSPYEAELCHAPLLTRLAGTQQAC